MANPVSSARDGRTPDLTRVLICEVQAKDHTQRLCIKLYPSCPDGMMALNRHALFLSGLKGSVPVPEVIDVVSKPDAFGFPALVTTAPGQPLDHGLKGCSAASADALVVGLAHAVAALHNINPSDLSLDPSFDPDLVLATWREDVEWYKDNAGRAGDGAGLVCEGASALAQYPHVPRHACVTHRDLTPHNILAQNGGITLVDWDHAGLAPPQEDVGKILIGLLAMLAIPRSLRLGLGETFLQAYAETRSLSPDELLLQSLPFALDTVLDWVVGGKNAPGSELRWATEQILKGKSAF
jgi:aminoglycoside phosphotransferase (APT) family kinase protein